jgi:two-component system invasion response regulator UvrY
VTAPASDEDYAVYQARLIARFKARAAKPVPSVRLNRRELEFVALVVEGKKLSEIAEEMGISVRTCAHYREYVLLKIGGTSNQDIVFYAMKMAGV